MSRKSKKPASEAGTRLGAIAIFLVAMTPARALAGEPASFTAISPIFGQLVAFSQPADFRVAFEKPTADRYLREAVLKGETVEQWTQMITVSGAKGLASNRNLTPSGFVGMLADGFNKACPETYAANPIGDLEISGYDAFAAVASCGAVKSPNGEHSETALVVAIKGESDYYTIQWAERTDSSDEPLAIDEAAWKERLDMLGPILLCPIVPGEKAPYPSCVEQD
jgi:hypothetical protein